MKEQLLKIPQVAEILAVSTKTIYRLINTGKLTAIKIRQATRISENEVLQYIEQCTQKGKVSPWA